MVPSSLAQSLSYTYTPRELYTKIAPFLGRLAVALENDIGGYPEGEGPTTLNEFRQNEKFTRFSKYLQDVTSRGSFTKTFDKVSQCDTVTRIYIPDFLTSRST